MADPSTFYDDFIGEQSRKGVNDRIYALYTKSLAHGLTPNARVLELGCGIGTLTYLLSKHITHGYVEAMDISPKSIEFAKRQNKSSHVQFRVGDAVTYVPEKTDFDFILAYDMLEHIPKEQHRTFFVNVAKSMSGSTQLLVNIPNPFYLEFLHANRPDTLQPTDQPVYLNDLVEAIYTAGLYCVSVETHSVSFQDDYQFIVVRKQQPFEEIPLSALRSVPERIVARLKRARRNWLHRYPRTT